MATALSPLVNEKCAAVMRERLELDLHGGHIDRLQGIYESVGCDHMYGRVHACKEAQACVACSSMRTVCEPFKILKILKLSG